MALTRDDVIKYINETLEGAGVQDLVCPICGHDKWGLGTDSTLKGALPVVSTGTDRGIEGGRHLPVVWLQCARCAYVLMFGKKAIDAWLSRLETDTAAPVRREDDG